MHQKNNPDKNQTKLILRYTYNDGMADYDLKNVNICEQINHGGVLI